MSADDPTQVRKRSRFRRRHAWLLSIGLVVIGIAGFYRYFWFEHPVGSGPAGPAVPREPFQRVWSTRKVLLVGLGDSITAGFGATPKHSYFDRLVENPTDEFETMRRVCLSKVLPKLQERNLAISGSTSVELRKYLLKRLETQDRETFGVVVVTTGGNDLIHNYGRTPPREGAMYGATFKQAEPWIKNFDVRLGEILDEIESRFPGGCRIFLANIYDPTDDIGDAFNAGLPPWPEGLRIVHAYNDIITRCASRRERVHLVDIHGEFLGHGIHCLQFWREHYDADDPRYWYFDNLEDPNDRGYDAIRRLMLIEIARVLPGVLSDRKQ